MRSAQGPQGVIGSVWESVKHCYAFVCTSLLINTQHEREHMATTRLSHTHNRLLMGGGKKKIAWPESQTRKLIYCVCVFSGMAAAFHFSSFPCPLRGPRLSGPPTNWGLHTRQVHHLASERMNTSLSNVFQMSAGILERVGFVKYPMTPCTSTVWPWGIVWACGVISMRRMYNNLLAYTNYKSKDKWTQKRRQTLCNLNEASFKARFYLLGEIVSPPSPSDPRF